MNGQKPNAATCSTRSNLCTQNLQEMQQGQVIVIFYDEPEPLLEEYGALPVGAIEAKRQAEALLNDSVGTQLPRGLDLEKAETNVNDAQAGKAARRDSRSDVAYPGRLSTRTSH